MVGPDQAQSPIAVEPSQTQPLFVEPDFFSSDRIARAMLTLSRDDPWDSGGSFVASYHEKEIATYALGGPEARTAAWRASDCRAQLCGAERQLRSDAFRLEEGLKPWALLVATMGTHALTDDAECSPLHWAAEAGTWYALDPKVLTAESMLQPNLANETPFELGARRQTLRQLDAEVLSAMAVSRNHEGDIPLHHAARQGYLLLLPAVLKSDDMLALEDSTGCSVFERHRAVQHAMGSGADSAA
jgi:hypothetical protein